LDVELGVITFGATHHMLVVDAGKNRADGKTKNGVFEFLLDGHN
jgi:hypothetical protein